MENDMLMKQISNLYDNRFAYLINDYDKTEWVLTESLKIPLVNKFLTFQDTTNPSVFIKNFEEMKANEEFSNLLSLMIVIRSSGVENYEIVMGDIDGVIALIKRELSQLKG